MKTKDSKSELFKIVSFIKDIGISIESRSIEHQSFLPGIHIENGTIYYEVDKLRYPGDLIHEAGHLALMEPNQRATAAGDLEPSDGVKINQNSLEVGVIIWTWAAIEFLKIDPKIVFHQEGYKGASDWYIESFSQGNFIGLPLLEWMEMTSNETFPLMKKWLRE